MVVLGVGVETVEAVVVLVVEREKGMRGGLRLIMIQASIITLGGNWRR
jgi:hypothetical protein